MSESRYAVVRGRAEAASASVDSADPSAAPVPATARAVISFSYTLLSGWGLVRNPHVAVWVESPAGELVRTVLVKDMDGVNTMDSWYGALGRTETTSSSTKPAGANSVEWDLTDDSGRRVAAGEYHVCIEASREMGPYELVRQPVRFGHKPATHHLRGSGELATALVEYTV
ncbi:MAG: DUF2271 domain-containing protein [Dermatophilaceae bacterium]